MSYSRRDRILYLPLRLGAKPTYHDGTPKPPLCRNCHEPIPADLVRDGADACSLQCVREYVIRGRGRS